MNRVRFILKNGKEIPVVCEKCEVTTHKLSGELLAYSLTGIEGKYPLYVRVSEIAAIVDERKVADDV